MASHPTTHIRWADHRPSAPGHEAWGTSTHSHLSITGETQPGTELPFLTPLLSGFPFSGRPQNPCNQKPNGLSWPMSGTGVEPHLQDPLLTLATCQGCS